MGSVLEKSYFHSDVVCSVSFMSQLKYTSDRFTLSYTYLILNQSTKFLCRELILFRGRGGRGKRECYLWGSPWRERFLCWETCVHCYCLGHDLCLSFFSGWCSDLVPLELGMKWGGGSLPPLAMKEQIHWLIEHWCSEKKGYKWRPRLCCFSPRPRP